MIKIGKTYRDGFGHDVRIVAQRATSDAFCFVGLLMQESGEETLTAFTAQGEGYGNDLIIPPVMLDLTQVQRVIRGLAADHEITEDAAETVLEALEKLDA